MMRALLILLLSAAAAYARLASHRTIVTFDRPTALLQPDRDTLIAYVAKAGVKRATLHLKTAYDKKRHDVLLRASLSALAPSSKVIAIEEDVLVSIVSPRERQRSIESAHQRSLSAPVWEWHLADAEPYSIHAEHVYGGSSAVSVAVIDNGIASAVRGAFANPSVAEYDFISDPGYSLDGDGRDPDATDPGDAGPGCPNPTWHGSRMAAAIGMQQEWAQGLHSVAPNTEIQFIRVLGLCAMGYASDVADAIVWAAGGNVAGVPPNPSPSTILSLSLNGPGACPLFMQEAVDFARGSGAFIYTSAGSTAGQSVTGTFPANCVGVLPVGASTRDGLLAPYSSVGAPILAPGGDDVNPIPTLDLDDTGAINRAGSPAGQVGTSFSAALAAGAGALALSWGATNPILDVLTAGSAPANPSLPDILDLSLLQDNLAQTALVAAAPVESPAGVSDSSLFVQASAASQTRTLRWWADNTTDNLFNGNTASWLAAAATPINFMCSDAAILTYITGANVTFAVTNTGMAESTFDLAICSYLRPAATNAGVARTLAIANLNKVVASYTGPTSIDQVQPLLRYCLAYDLLKPDLDAATYSAFATFGPKLINGVLNYWWLTKSTEPEDNWGTQSISFAAVCAQATSNAAVIAQAQTNVTRLLGSDVYGVANLYNNGTSWDFFGRDALFYQAVTLQAFVDMATFIPNYFYTVAQWQRIERALTYMQQFTPSACASNPTTCVWHREFIATTYAPDKTTLHGNLYNKTWVDGGANSIFLYGRVPFLSVRPWADAWWKYPSFIGKHSPYWALRTVPYGIYQGTTTFGAYDNVGNNFAQVAVYVMRPGVDLCPTC